MDTVGHNNTDNCSVCKDEGKIAPATHWCSECETSLCDRCLRQHSRMPGLRHHGVSLLTVATPREQVTKTNFICKEHNKKIQLFCKDCKKKLCTVCCSVDHRACRNVFGIQAMLLEVTEELVNRQNAIADKVDDTTKHIDELKMTTDELDAKITKAKAEIKQTFDDVAALLQRKKTQLLTLVDAIKGKQTEKLKAKIKQLEKSRQTYQQQSQFIQQCLDLENEAQLYDMYLSSGSEAVDGNTETNSDYIINVVDIRFTYNMEKLRENMDMMDVTTDCDDVIDLTEPPVLQKVVDMKLGGGSSDLRDVVVLNNNGIKSIVVSETTYSNYAIKSVYMKDVNIFSSRLKLKNYPWGLTEMSPSKVMVALPNSNQILTIYVNPDLFRMSKIITTRGYYGLAVLDVSTLVAGTGSHAEVDILDMEGNVLRSFTRLPSIQKSFSKACYLHVTNNGNILVSDNGLKSVICLTPTGEVVFQYSPTGHRALTSPYGITSTATGDILLADLDAHKVIHLTQSGEFVKDILTSQDGLHDPYGLCVDGDKLYVATKNNGVSVFRFS